MPGSAERSPIPTSLLSGQSKSYPHTGRPAAFLWVGRYRWMLVWVLLGVLLGAVDVELLAGWVFGGCCWVFAGRNWLLLGVVGCWWELVGVGGSWWVLLGVGGC